MAQLPGAEFFDERLHRATAVPPAQRSADVASFVRGAALLRRCCELLPLTPDGAAALPACGATWRQLLRALLCVVATHHCCPIPLDSSARNAHTIFTYMDSLDIPADNRLPSWINDDGSFNVSNAFTRGAAAAGPLAPLLLLFSVAGYSGGEGMEAAGRKLAALLQNASYQRSVRRQLAEMAVEEQQRQQQAAAAGGKVLEDGEAVPILSLEQLQHVCHAFLAMRAWAAKWQLEASSARAMVALEPNNPLSHLWSGLASRAEGMCPAAIASFLRAYGLACEQNSPCVRAKVAADAIISAAQLSHRGQLSPACSDLLEQALSAYAVAVPAFKRCRRLLPLHWVDEVHRTVDYAAPLTDSCRAQLSFLRSTASGGTALANSADMVLRVQRAREKSLAAAEAWNQRGNFRCDGCGESALGLRACGACKAVRYCSMECQREHWEQHKVACRAAQAAAREG